MKTNASSARSSERVAAAEAIGGLRTATDSAGDYADRLPGTRLRLRVQAVMPDGSFRVQLDGKPAFLRLPGASARPGALVEAEVVGTAPRTTLVLRGIVPETDTPSLSSTARLLAAIPGTLLADADAASLTGTAPVISGSHMDARTLGDALKRVIEHSGVFYESHLAQWLTGRRSKEDLSLEPQARLDRASAHETISSANAHAELLPGNRTVSDAEAPVIHPDALSVVQQQLIALDTGHLLWRGEVWNGQALEWRIAREGNSKQCPYEFHSWQTRLRLTLPKLGGVEATVSFAPSGVDVKVTAASRSAADVLSADAGSLAQAMHEAGLNVSRVEVAHANG